MNSDSRTVKLDSFFPKSYFRRLIIPGHRGGRRGKRRIKYELRRRRRPMFIFKLTMNTTIFLLTGAGGFFIRRSPKGGVLKTPKKIIPHVTT